VLFEPLLSVAPGRRRGCRSPACSRTTAWGGPVSKFRCQPWYAVCHATRMEPVPANPTTRLQRVWMRCGGEKAA